jgi:hypothetical protein
MRHTLRFEQQNFHPPPYNGMLVINTLVTELIDIFLAKIDLTHNSAPLAVSKSFDRY